MYNDCLYTVPSAPDVVVLPRYSTDATLLKLTVQFSESVSPYQLYQTLLFILLHCAPIGLF